MGLIQKKLEQWQQAGLISPAEHAAIMAFEASQPARPGTWLYSFMLLGIAIIGLGIISLIAANWATLPDSVKLGADLALLLALAVSIYYCYPTHPTGFEVLTAGFLLLCLASFGLIAQVFHSNHRWYHALLFWAAITFWISLYANSLFTRFLWTSLFVHGLLWSLLFWNQPVFSDRLAEFPGIILLAPLLTALLLAVSQRIVALQGFTGSLFFWFQVSAVVALAFADIARSGGELGHYDPCHYLPAYVTAAVLAAGILTQPYYRWLNKGLLLAVLLLLLLYYHPDWLFTGHQRYNVFGTADHTGVSFWQADDMRAPLLTLLILFLYAIHAGNSGYVNTFNLVTFLIGLRFVILYFQAMGGLAATGVGLILSGSLIMGMAWLWYRGRTVLGQWARRLPS